ncbi:MAG TPA: DNA ligase D [Solirubrobacteraceae bacterium]|nr:DNA ligase D [Solirubrobacteraceae bacterium]
MSEARKLGRYRAKRDFAATPEPSGEAPAGAPARRRFVVQEHHATRLHWDLRLERDGVLVSWAVPNGLPTEPRDNRLAVHTEDHPLEYLEFHGEIPRGSYGAGTMTIWDRGTYEELKWEPRKVEVLLHGERVHGRYALFPIDAGEDPKDWMIHRMDPPADPAAEPMPEKVVPMLARLGELPPDDGRWAYEVKWDGVRAICHSEPGRMRLYSRNLNDITPRYPELARLNRALSHHRAILDGEVVAFGAEGRPDFGALQQRMHLTAESQVRRLARSAPVTYVLFDLLWLDGHSLLDAPYEERRARLAELALTGERWQTPDHVVGHGAELLAASMAQGLEGIVAKKLGSRYEPGRRSPCWIKVKNVHRQEVVIGGWLPGEGRRRDRIGALLVGVRDGEDGALRYAGRVGTGFTEAELDRLRALLAPLEQDRSPFAEAAAPAPKPPRGAVWVAPRLVAEVEFRDWTQGGQLRAPSYKGMRDDKPAELVVREGRDHAMVEVDGTDVRLANPDKVLYPATGFRKRDVVDYYARIAPVLLPHLEGRPLTLKRYPDGVDGPFFYEKQAPSHRPAWVRTARIPMGSKPIEFVLAEDVRTLVWLANLADLELHTSLSRAADMAHPTTLAFDLDPGPPATVVECSRVALLLEGMFAGLGLQSFAKTSGSKGMQVYVPLDGRADYAATKGFARAVAELLEREEPKLVVSRMTKSLRPGKVLVDYSQNDESKTTVCVYSLRARERPTVSTPVTWDEVRETARREDPGLFAYTAHDVLRRVEERGDLFAPVVSLTQALPG